MKRLFKVGVFALAAFWTLALFTACASKDKVPAKTTQTVQEEDPGVVLYAERPPDHRLAHLFLRGGPDRW